MTFHRLVLGVGILGLVAIGATARSERAEWVPLFDGQSLDGWTAKIRGYPLGENFGNTFRVKDGLLQVSYDAYDGKFNDRFGHLFFKQPYSNYRLKMVYRFVGEQIADGPGWAWRNSGAMLHSQDPKTMALDQDFPVSIELQLLGGNAEGDRTTANMCSPGTNVVMDGKLVTQHCVNSSSKTFRGDQWVTVEAEVRGNKVTEFFVNGDKVFTYEQPQLDPTDASAKMLIVDDELQLEGGYIALQSESHPIEFKSVEVLVR